MNRTRTNWKVTRRFQAWHLQQKGWSPGQIAAALDVSKGAVSQWIKRAQAEGPEALDIGHLLGPRGE
jgi:transposase